MQAAPGISLDLTNVGVELTRAADWVLAHCVQSGLSADDSYRIDLVVAEALGNIASYAYSGEDELALAELSWRQNPGGVMLVIKDSGWHFDPTRRASEPPAAELSQVIPGGMGIALMRRYSDAISYHRELGCNQLTLYFAIDAASLLGAQAQEAVADGRKSDLAKACRCPLFKGLDESALVSLLEKCPVRQLSAGEVLLAEGQINHHLYIVLSGELAVGLRSSSGHSMLTIQAGECLGELSIIDGMPASAGVRANSDAELLVVSDELFWERVTLMPRLARNMLKVLTERVRRQNELTLDAMEQQLRFEHMGRELSLAADLQSSMLPMDFERFGEDLVHADVHALMEPARDVGGDFYDIFMVDNDRICVAVGDVSGKGMPAALFMVRSMTLLRTQVRKKRSLSKSMAVINQLLCENNPTNMFVTMVVAVINLRRRELRWVNGGHCAPLHLRRKGELQQLDAPRGILLGVDDSVVFPEGDCRFRPGDSLLLYSDGVTEARNASGELFGEQRLLAALGKSNDDNAERLVRRVRTSLADYAADADVADDITLLAFYHQR